MAVMPLESYSTVDYHTGGEPFRIVADPPVALPGTTVAERRVLAMASSEVERMRQVLCFEPRGHADMYGGFIVPPDDDGAHFGVLFWHKDGFSTACGHGTIALGVWAVETGLVARDPGGVTDVVIDVPSGRVTARVHTDGERIDRVDFINVASRVVALGVPVSTSLGDLVVDVSFGGANYAQLDAASVGLTVEPHDLQRLIAIGREIKWALDDSPVAQHPTDPRLSGIYGTIVYDRLGVTADGELHQRNVTIFADGEVDRSPCGSGTCARLATLAATGDLAAGANLVHDSIVGSRFLGSYSPAADGTVIPRVTGLAHRTGASVFTVDPHDSLVPGFVLR
jgi:proline racemase